MAGMEWKDITVFISSTFNDMHAERDYLVKYVFPELRDWCAQRKLRLNDIDLRWGITIADGQTRRTVGICLRDIDKSRPYFIGFLGQRRGWQPGVDDIDEETKREYPDLQDRIRTTSVTELEIEHALLAPLLRIAGSERVMADAAKHAFLFLREDTFTERLSPAQKRVYTNWAEAAEGEDPAVSPRVRQADEDLQAFKEKLKARVPGTRYYRADFDMSLLSPELGGQETEEGHGRLARFVTEDRPLKDVLLQDLKEAILEDYPERRNPAAATTDQDIRDNYIQRMAEGYIERKQDLDAVMSYLKIGIPDPDQEIGLPQRTSNGAENRTSACGAGKITAAPAHITGEITAAPVSDSDGIMVVHGLSGSGKTTLLAEIFRRAGLEQDTRAAMRCCGVGNDTTTVYSLFCSLFEELGVPLPIDEEDLRANISVSLSRAAEMIGKAPDAITNDENSERFDRRNTAPGKVPEKLIILLDALDQIPQGPEILSWLPASLPENVRLVATIRSEFLTGDIDVSALEERGAVLYRIQPFTDPEEKKVLVDGYLSSHLKKLEDRQMETLLGKSGSDNPLYLLAALSELRVTGKIELMEQRLENFGNLPEDIFDSMMQRMEEDYLSEEIDEKKTVSLLCSLLSVSRYGLYREELESIFAAAFPEMDREDLSGWIQVYLRQMREFLLQFGTLTDFRYFALRRAAAARYREIEKESHGRIASFFLEKMGTDFREADERALKETVYHLLCSEPGRAFRLITDPAFMIRKIRICGTGALIGDFEAAASNPELESGLRESGIQIAAALKKSAYILAEDPDALPGQMALRLSPVNRDSHHEESRINLTLRAFLERFEKSTDRAWIRTLAFNEGNSDYTMLREHQDRIIGLFACAYGILIVETDGAVKILSDDDGSVLRTIRGEGLKISCACLADDDLYILEEKGEVFHYRVSSGTFRGKARVLDVRPHAAVMGDGLILAADVKDGIVSIDARTLEVRARLNHAGGAECLSVCGEQVILGGRYGKVLVCRQDTLEILQTYDPNFGLISAIHAEKDAIYAGGDTGLLVRIDRKDGSLKGNIQEWDSDYVCTIFREGDLLFSINGYQAIKYSPDLEEISMPEGVIQSARLAVRKNDRIYFLTSDHRLGYLSADALVWENRLRNSYPAAGLCLSGDRVLLRSSREGMQLFERSSGREIKMDNSSLRTVKLEEEKIVSAAAMDDGFLIGTDSGKLMWIGKDGEIYSILHNRPSRDIMDPYYVSVKYLDRCRDLALYVGFHKLILLQDPVRNLCREIPSLGTCEGLVMDADRFYFAVNGEVKVCRLPSGELIRKFEIPKGQIYTNESGLLAKRGIRKMVLDSGLLYIGYHDRVLAYDVESGNLVKEILSPSIRDYDVRGDYFFEAPGDKTIRITRGGVPLCRLTLDEIPTALTCSHSRRNNTGLKKSDAKCTNEDNTGKKNTEEDLELYVGTNRGAFLKMRVENPDAETEDLTGKRDGTATRETAAEPGQSPEDTITEPADGGSITESIDDETPSKPWKYQPPELGNYKLTGSLFKGLTIMILVLSAIGALIFYSRMKLANPGYFAKPTAQDIQVMKENHTYLPHFVKIAAAVLFAFLPVFAVRHGLNNVRKERSYYSRNRKAEYCLPVIFLWAAGSIFYLLAMMAVPASSILTLLLIHYGWMILWMIAGFIDKAFFFKSTVFYGPGASFTVIQRCYRIIAAITAAVMAGLLAFVLLGGSI